MNIGAAMFRKLIGACVGLAILAMSANSAHAILLYDNGAWANCFCGATSINGTNQQDVADDFTPTDNWGVNAATWVGLFADGVVSSLNRSFVIEIFSDATGEPSAIPIFVDTVMASATLLSPAPGGNEGFEAYTFATSFNMTAFLIVGETYYFSTTDAGPGTGGSTGMFWTGSVIPDGFWFRSGDTGSWMVNSSGVAFSLSGDTSASAPEPSTLALFATGLALLGFIGWRRRGVVRVKAA